MVVVVVVIVKGVPDVSCHNSSFQLDTSSIFDCFERPLSLRLVVLLKHKVNKIFSILFFIGPKGTMKKIEFEVFKLFIQIYKIQKYHRKLVSEKLR